jgi:hypothetical protein
MKNTCKMPLFLSFLWQFAINLVLLPTSSASAPVVSGGALQYQRKIQ